MPGTKEIKRRINSIKNTKKITKAMELVAASKMKRAVSATLASRLYAEYSREVLASVAETLKKETHPFFDEGDAGKSLIVVITSNRGLCGGYNSQILKKTIQKLRELNDANEVEVITVGKKGNTAMRRVGQNIAGVFTDMPDVNISLSDTVPLSKMIMEEFSNQKYNRVYVAYTHFTSTLSQTPVVKQLLPITQEDIERAVEETTAKRTRHAREYLFEGDFDSLVAALAEKITRRRIYQMILEANASEQSARMMAMKNASEASGEMIDDLTLVFNKARQANITREISEISAGMATIG